uniref:Uncharacterized protein n=1 Tax=Glossina palpalis gambiensis TaxID=67801 RepID=A0A1B0AV30_9MUSC
MVCLVKAKTNPLRIDKFLNIGNNKCYIINETTVKTLYTIKDTIDPHKPNETGFVSANECLLLSRII